MRRLKTVAHHEAGHAVMAHALGLPLKAVSIKRTKVAHGQTVIKPPRCLKSADAKDDRARIWVQKTIMSSMAGFMAEEDQTGRASHARNAGDYRTLDELASVVCYTPVEHVCLPAGRWRAPWLQGGRVNH